MIPLYKQTNVNDVPARNVYGTSSGPTLGTVGGSLTPWGAGDGGSTVSGSIGADGQTSASPASSSGLTGESIAGKPLTWWGVLVLVLLGVMWLAKRYGGGDGSDFKNVRLTVYNMFVITVNAVVGIAFLKIVFSRFKVPGLSALVLSV